MNTVALVANQAGINNVRPFLFREAKPASPKIQLKNIPFLSSVSKEALDALLGKAKTLNYSKRAVIISEGADANAFFILLSGKVRIFSADDKCKEITLNVQGPGTCFGEIALLTGEMRSVSVMALEASSCAVISKGDFMNWLENHPDATLCLLGSLSEKIRQLTDKVRQLALSNVYERTIQTLQEMAVAEGNVNVIHSKPTQQELASLVGASREMVGKIMHDLIKGGYVEIIKNGMVIHKRLPSSW